MELSLTDQAEVTLLPLQNAESFQPDDSGSTLSAAMGLLSRATALDSTTGGALRQLSDTLQAKGEERTDRAPKYNGWTLFRREFFEENPRRAGETSSQRVQRVNEEARLKWTSDPALRKRMTTKATMWNKQMTIADKRPQHQDPQQLQLLGACGQLALGDSEFPIAERLLEHVSSAKSFVNSAHKAWVNLNSHIIPDAVLPPAPKGAPQALSDHGGRGLVRGLLRNILRMMRTQKRERLKQGIQAHVRHPLLLLKMPDRELAWCLIRATFKPLALLALRANYDAVRAVCTLQLDAQDMDSMVDDMEAIVERSAAEHDAEAASYALPSYEFRWETPMSTLHLNGDVSWVEWSSADIVANGSSDSSAADDSDPDSDPDEPHRKDKAAQDTLDLLLRMKPKPKSDLENMFWHQKHPTDIYNI